MTTTTHKRSPYSISATNKRRDAKRAKGRANAKWIKAYSECLFEARAVEIIHKHEQEVNNYFW